MKKRLIYIIGVFLLLLSPVLSQAQISYQYWIDDNKEAAVSGTTTDGTALSLSIDAAELTTGVHFLNMRAREGKKWGTVYRKLFAIPRPANDASADLKGYEYWIDNDYANRVSANASGSSRTATFSVDASSLSTGIHFFNMRVQDANGQWGTVKRQVFCIPREQQADADKLITGYRYGFGDALTTVTLDTPVSEYTLTKQLDVPDPPQPVVIDDDCHFSFSEGEATLLRNVEMSFILTFTDQSKAMSSPVGTSFTVTDIQTTDILKFNVPGSQTIPAHASGGYTVTQFDIVSAGTYILKSTATCSLRLYSEEGEFINGITSEGLTAGYPKELEVGTYYAIAFGNATETSLSVNPDDPSLITVATPVFSYEGDVITITTATPNATIYYTLDGTDPTEESLVYTDPFTVTDNCTITAIAKRDGYYDSEISSLMVDWIVVGTPCGYAIFDSETNTLTFKYGIMPEGNNVWETDNTNFVDNSENLWLNQAPWVSNNLTKVVFDASYADARPTSTAYWFNRALKLEEIKGMEYLNTSQVTTMDYMFGYCNSLTNLDVSHFDTGNVTSMSYMFRNYSQISLDLSHFDTSKVTDMSGMFFLCSSLTILDLNNFDTSKVTNMADMFNECKSLTSLNVSSFNTSNVTNMSNMFSYCNSLTSLDVSSFNTSKVTNMAYMFKQCKSLTSLDVRNFDTSNVTNIGGMFSDCSSFINIDVSLFDTSNVLLLGGLFSGCSSLTNLDLGNFDTSNATSMTGMFSGCKGLANIDLRNFDTSNVTDMTFMFSECSGLSDLDLGSFDTSKVTDMNWMFMNCPSLTTIYVGEAWSTDAVTNDTGNMFEGCTSLVGGKGTVYDTNHVDKEYARIDGGTSAPGYFTPKDGYPELCGYAILDSNTGTLTFKYGIMPEGNNVWETDNTGTTFPSWLKPQIQSVVFESSYAQARPTSTYGWFNDLNKLTKITGIEYLNTSLVTNMSSMFENCCGLTSLDVSNFNTENVTSMKGMFSNCSGITSLNVSNFNTENVTGMSFMFEGCSGLTSLDVSNFNTENVTNMFGMFMGCSSLTSLNVSGFNTSKVTNMGYMFKNCPRLTSLDVSNFNTENVTGMSFMFSNCSGLTSLNVSNFNTSNVTTMENMFFFCRELTSLDVSSFDTSNVTKMGWMFRNCGKLTTLNLSNFNTENVTWMASMFDACYSLENLDISSFNTEKVTNMNSMFIYCHKLTELNLSHFDTSNVTDMGYMFHYCNDLTSLNVSSFNTSKVENMRYMFSECNNLETLDLSSFDTGNVTDMDSVFYSMATKVYVSYPTLSYGFDLDASKLKKIYVSDKWNTGKVTSSSGMFFGCTNLVGGKGTTYNPSHVDKAYARIDGGTAAPGYFSEKIIQIMGDVNGDGVVDVADAVETVNYILGNASTNFNKSNADMNSDGKISVFDVTAIINIILSGSDNPAPSRMLEQDDETLESVYLRTNNNTVLLGIDDAARFTAFQFDVEVPQDVELTGVDWNAPMDSHLLQFVKTGDNRYMVVALSMTSTPLSSWSDTLLKLRLSDKSSGMVSLDNIIFVTPQGEKIRFNSNGVNMTTGIQGITSAQNDQLYDLSGRRLNMKPDQLPKGVYIINRKKVVIK